MAANESGSVRKFFSSRWFVVVGGILAFILLFNYLRAYYQSYEIQKEIERLEKEKEGLDMKYLKTVDMLKYVQSPAYVESKARVELNMIKPGEHAAIVQGQSATGTARQSEKPMVESTSNPKRWWNYFFGKN